ncbi:MAG: FIST N-terminal domain-containing protein [Candidatus Auribacterota bacterium]
MQAEQKRWSKEAGWKSLSENQLQDKAQLVFVFGQGDMLKLTAQLVEIKELYPKAQIVGCSTAGEIIGEQIFDNSLVTTALYFEKTRLKFAKVQIDDMKNSFNAGKLLAEQLQDKNLRHVFVLSDGLNVNGSALAKGLCQGLPQNVAVTGGMAGDQANFKETLVVMDTVPEKNVIAGVGFYGDEIEISYGSMGGWSSFGIDRLVTRSEGNILYELDGQLALDLYKTYLGEKASGLPTTGLLFPLSIRLDNGEKHLVRTVMAVNEKDGSMTFAGDIPEGSYVRLMKANINHLVEGAANAATMCYNNLNQESPVVAILISCVGRKLILKQRAEEEIEVIGEKFGNTTLTGFYSYGEICPMDSMQKKAELHNQTMTITCFKEKA